MNPLHNRSQPSFPIVRLGLVLALLSLPLWTACSNNENAAEADTEVATNEGMEFFEGSYEDAIALAKEEEKLVFVDVWTTWCGPCIVMQETVFPLPEVGDYFNARFVNYKLDAEDEDQNGPEISAQFEINVVPTYLILDGEGNELGRATGGCAPDQFIDMIGQVLGEVESEFDDMRARYVAGERSPEFIQQYLMDAIVEKALQKNSDARSLATDDETIAEADNYSQIANEYFGSRPYSALINEIDARLIMHYRFSKPRGEELVEFVIENYDAFVAVSSDSAMTQFVLDATLGAVADAARAGDEKFLEYIAALETEPLKKAVDYERNRNPNSRLLPERIKYSWEADFLIATENWDGVHDLYKDRLEKRGDSATANNYKWAASNLIQSTNPTHQEIALEWAKTSYEMDSTDLFVVLGYIDALVYVEKPDEARTIAQEFRSSLTDSAVDQKDLEILNNWTSSLFDESERDSSDAENE